MVDRDYSHPCIVAWVPFNESWGVPNLPDSPAERHYVQALYHLTKTLDPTRPVVGNDGWESVATDIIGIHDYDEDPERIASRYFADDALPKLFRRERPGGRMLVLEGHKDQPVMLTEFGGIALSDPGKTWGYSRAASSREFAERYRNLLAAVRSSGLFAGFCYTQFADTYQEATGLLYDGPRAEVSAGGDRGGDARTIGHRGSRQQHARCGGTGRRARRTRAAGRRPAGPRARGGTSVARGVRRRRWRSASSRSPTAAV